MAQQVKVNGMLFKPSNLRSIPGTHMKVETEN